MSVCIVCGKPKKKTSKKYCSIPCRNAGNADTMTKDSKYIICEVCRKVVRIRPSWDRYRKTCSKKCMGVNQVGEKNQFWAGDDVTYYGLHSWLHKQVGQAQGCQNCGMEANPKSNRPFHWANISGLYKRDIKDFISLCVSCHRIFDYLRHGKSVKLDVIKNKRLLDILK